MLLLRFDTSQLDLTNECKILAQILWMCRYKRILLTSDGKWSIKRSCIFSFPFSFKILLVVKRT